MTPGEVRLWQRLRGRRLGVAFKRQRPVGPYIVDFYCSELQLVVEVDGGSHREKGPQDLERQAFLEAEGLDVLRFPESEIYRGPEGAVQHIREAAESIRAAQPSPPLGEVPPKGAEGVLQSPKPTSSR